MCIRVHIVDVFYATADEADAYMFYIYFFAFFVFFVRHKNTRQPFSGTAERIFMKLLPNERVKWSLHRRTQMGARPPD